MRTNINAIFHGSLAIVALAGLLAAPTATAQTIMKPKPQAAMVDFQQFLPPVASIPWLEAKRSVPQRPASFSPLPEAGSVSALLLAPQPAATWALGPQAASAGLDLARM